LSVFLCVFSCFSNHLMVKKNIFSNESFDDDVRVRDRVRDRDLLLTYVYF
jgi:hypothetical protein